LQKQSEWGLTKDHDEPGDRLLTKEEAYKQISRNASVFRAILVYVEKQISERTF
jgi:hypothetical protein